MVEKIKNTASRSIQKIQRIPMEGKKDPPRACDHRVSITRSYPGRLRVRHLARTAGDHER